MKRGERTHVAKLPSVVTARPGVGDPHPPSANWLPIALAALLALIAFGVYAPSLDYGFTWDDPVVVEEQVPAIRTLSAAFFPPAGVPDLASNYYRPLVLLSYVADDALAAPKADAGSRFRAQARAFHRSSVLLHAIATAMVFALGLALARVFNGGRRGVWAAGAAGLLFAVHPIHVDSAASVVGRSDVLCAVFGVAALALYAVHRRRGGRIALWASAALALLSMLAKEPGVGLIALVLLIDALDRRERPGIAPRALRYGLFAAAAAAYAAMRWAALSRLGGAAQPNVAGSWLDLPRAFGWYLVKAVWPPLQTPFVAALPAGLLWVGVIGAIAFAAAAWALLRAGWRRELLALAVFVAALAPSLAVPVLGASHLPVAERYLYLPTAGLCLLAGFLLDRAGAALAERTKFSPARCTTVVAAVAIAVPAAWQTLSHERIWRDDVSLWTHAAQAAPDQGIPEAQLGSALADAGRFDDAAVHYARAATLFPAAADRAKALNNLGSIHQRSGRYAEARAQFLRAITLSPDPWPARYNLALTDVVLAGTAADPGSRRRFLDEAQDQLQRALETNPSSVDAHLQLGLLEQRLGQDAAARRHLLEVLRLAPSGPEAQAAARALAR